MQAYNYDMGAFRVMNTVVPYEDKSYSQTDTHICSAVPQLQAQR